MSLLLRQVELEEAVVDVRIEGDRIVEIGAGLCGSSRVVEARGGTLLPGLHDHHLHLFAMAAAMASIDCSESLDALATAPVNEGWVRGFGTASTPDRHDLDAVRSDVPVRVQHRSGALWMLNSRALAEVSSWLDGTADVERDKHGEPTGRLFRYDARLRAALPSTLPDLGGVVARLHRYGITGVTDATPDLSPAAVEALTALSGIRVTLLGGLTGPRKLLLRDHDLPTYDDLVQVIGGTHAAGRPVAVHCVTPESLLLTLAALREVGSVPGDRIEHAAVVPIGIAEALAALGLAVVTQPSFLRLRGDEYLRDLDREDIARLYPYRSLLDAGVRVAASSDAPYGDADPWRTMADAAARRTRRGRVLGPRERVNPVEVLTGYLSPPDDPGGAARRVEVGALADLCLLKAPLRSGEPQVRAVVVGGEAFEQP
ncbi:amidohydrolase family protein [Georgenia ruanii]|uniref:Amidohydrolase family protein n=1 Tax=Georgenia ruanii TaxID=348442 RepID=A0A7J9UV40_9MICO|nr:amidohydrolase family protein [Georgenia ruanii]MPV88478.1 amidohydrolase family protein [Georgenia ruanii]